MTNGSPDADSVLLTHLEPLSLSFALAGKRERGLSVTVIRSVISGG